MADEKRQTFFIPITGGLGTDADERMRAPERLNVARNVRCPEIGTLGKRYGFTALTSLIAGGGAEVLATNGPVRGLASTNKELLALGHRNLYGYNSSLTGWVNRGHVSPCIGDTKETFRANVQYQMADGARYGNYIIHAAVRAEGWGNYAARGRNALEFRGVDVNGDTLFAPTIDEKVIVTGDHPYTVRCAAHNAGVAICWTSGDPGDAQGTVAQTLKRHDYLSATPYTAPVAIADVTADLYLRSGTRTYDAIHCGGGYLVGYISHASRDIVLNLYNSTHVLQYTATIPGTFYAMALAEAADGHFYILTADVGGELGNEIDLYHYSNTLGAGGIWGPIQIKQLALTEYAENLGVVEGNNGTMLRAVCVFQIRDTSPVVYDTFSRSTDDAGTPDYDNGIETFNTNPLSRPFFYRNRCYLHVGTMTDVPYDGLGFESHMFLDLNPDVADRSGAHIRMAAMWGVGAHSGGAGSGFALGSVNNVWVMPDGVTHRLMCPFMAEALAPKNTGDLQYSDIRLAYDDVGFEFDAVPMAAPLHRGSAIIGGGYVVWYDGSRTFELGFAKPPMVHTTLQSNGTIPNATYTYSNVWQHVDAGGILHRSLPSPGKQEVLADASGTTDVTLTAQSLPGSRRPISDVTCQWFRAGGDNVAKRVNRSSENIPNTYSSATCQLLTDNLVDDKLYVAQYTTGGVLENVAPEGARIPFVTRERLWLGHFFSGDRIQYSKLVVPSTAGETAIAPELYEALGRISGNGEPITGISAMDATTVVFTTNRIYLVGGYGPDARGVGDDTSRLTEIPTDAGCIDPRSVVAGPDGVYFQTDRGIYLLSRGHEVTPIGEPVRVLMDTYSVCTSAVVVTKERQVRFTVTNTAKTDGRILVYDYRIGAWFEWHVNDEEGTVVPTGGTFVDSTYYICDTNNNVRYEDETKYLDDETVWITMTVETGAIQPVGPLRYMGVYNLGIMAQYMDDHKLTVDIYNNHATSADMSRFWTDSVLQSLNDEANRMDLLVKPVHPKVEAIRVRISDATDGSPSTGQGFEIHGIAADVTIYGGLPRLQEEARQ